MAPPAKILAPSPPLATRPVRWRIGLVALATDHTTESDFHSLRPGNELGIYVNRVPFTNPSTAENLKAMLPRLRDAASLILPDEPLDAVAYGCTAASALIGDGEICRAVRIAKPGVPVITPTSAAFNAFSMLGCRRVSVLAPYTESVTNDLVAYFEDGGLEVVNALCFGLADDTEIARVVPDAIVAAAESAYHPDAQALFVSCTALRAVAVAQVIEDRIGIPVVTSNQAMFWRTIREAGCDLTVSGYGRLLQTRGGS